MTIFLIVTYTVLVILAIAICRVASDEEANEIKRERGKKMAKTQTVTISLEEYKELLLKDKPNSNDHEMVERIFNEIEKHLVYSDSRYYDGYIGNEMKVDNSTEVIKEIMQMTKYVDFDRWMKMWNTVQTNERKRKAMKEQIDQMNRAKEIRDDQTD